MPGFAPCAADRARGERYARRAAAEQRVRRALCDGQKIYDADNP